MRPALALLLLAVLLPSRRSAAALVCLVVLIGSAGGASAFDCTGVKLPSSIVICSDPELMRLADERQHVINEVRWGMDPQRDKELLADQTGWVRSYATACGVPPNAPAPDPVPSTVKECFKRAAQARIAYLRAYGASAPPPAPGAPTGRAEGPPGEGGAEERVDEMCATVRGPFWTAACSDQELRLLAGSRIAAYREAVARLNPADRSALAESQRKWGPALARECGIAGRPTIPLASETRDCLIRGLRGRVAYLRAYVGQSAAGSRPPPASFPPPSSAPAATAASIGPSFDCNTVHQPLALIICASPALSKLDLRFVQAYQALRYQLDEPGRRELRDEDLQFLASVRQLCAIPETGPVSGSSECIAAQYERQRAIWTSRLFGPAAEEANRPIEQQIALKARLQKLGFVPSAVKVDGVYGDTMRWAILAWQKVNSRPETGFLGDADAAALTGATPREAKETNPGEQSPSAPSSGPISQLQSPVTTVSPPSSPGQSPSAPPGPPADPDWRQIDSSQLFGSDADVFGQVTEIYIDARSITRHGSTITAWIMNNTNEKGEEVRQLARQKLPQYTQTRKPETWSTIDEFELNCHEKQFRYLYVADFTDHMGKGGPIYWDDTNGVELKHPVMNGKELPSVWVSGAKGTGFDLPLLGSLCNGSLLRSLGVSEPEERPQGKQPTADSPPASPSSPLAEAPEKPAREPPGARARVINLCSSASGALWVAICSDYELRELSAERFEAYDKLVALLNAEQVDRGSIQQLFSGAESWEATYAAGCGVEPGVVPTVPLAPEMRDCLLRGARDLLSSLSERQRYWTNPCEGLKKSASRRVTLSPEAISARIQRPVASVTFEQIPSPQLDPLSFVCRLTVTLADGSSTFSDVTVNFSSAASMNHPVALAPGGAASPGQSVVPPASTAPFRPQRASADDPCTNPNHPQWQMPGWAMTLPAWRQMALHHQLELRRECQIKAQQRRDAENTAREAAQHQAEAQEVHKKAIEQGEALGYKLQSFDDFILDGKQLASDNAKIQIAGYYRIIGEGTWLFKSMIDALQDTRNSIPLLTEDAAREVRAYFLGCDRNPGTAQAGCQVTVGGQVQLCRYLDPARAEFPPVPCLSVEQGANQ